MSLTTEIAAATGIHEFLARIDGGKPFESPALSVMDIVVLVRPPDEMLVTALLSYRFRDGGTFRLCQLGDALMVAVPIRDAVLFLAGNVDDTVPDGTFRGQMRRKLHLFAKSLSRTFFGSFPEFLPLMPKNVVREGVPDTVPRKNGVTVTIGDGTCRFEFSTSFPCSVRVGDMEGFEAGEDSLLAFSPEPIFRVHDANAAMEIYDDIPLPAGLAREEENFLGYALTFRADEPFSAGPDDFPHNHILHVPGERVMESMQALAARVESQPAAGRDFPCAVTIYTRTEKECDDFRFMVASS